jgi:hypothetical protein
MYSSYSFSTSALDGDDLSASRPSRALVPGKGPPVPIVQETGWAPEPVWVQRLEEKSFRFCRGSNLHPPDVQPVARHYRLDKHSNNNWNYGQMERFMFITFIVIGQLLPFRILACRMCVTEDWTGRRGPSSWPPRSLDPTLNGFYFEVLSRLPPI